VVYAAKIDKDEARINWTDPAEVLDRQIRGLSPFPGAWCESDGDRVKLLDSRVVAGTGAPGTVLDPDLTIACGQGAIRPLRLQRAGRAAMTPTEFLRGFPLPEGSRLT
jgi:methionyl-tRNA formyltransferase